MAPHVAEVVQGYETRAEQGEEEERSRVEREIEGGDKSAEAAEEIAGVPEEEGEGDEAGGLKEAGSGGRVVERGNDLREDGEDEHGYCEGDGDGEGEVAEFEEEG